MYCIYHSRDLDGWMSAAIVKKWRDSVGWAVGATEPEYIGWDYGDPIPELEPGRSVVLCDISFPMKEMEAISKTNNLTWIDHHKSAIVDYYNYIGDGESFMKTFLPSRKMDNGKVVDLQLISACELTWLYFFPNKPLPRLVRLLGSYDSFRHKDTPDHELVLNVQYGARTYLGTPDLCLTGLNGVISVEHLATAGSAVRTYLDVEALSIYTTRKDFEFVGPGERKIKATCVNRSRFNPKTHGIDFHADGYDIFVCYHRLSDGKWVFSLYNDNNQVDVSEIAKSKGGGGHAGAAGFVAKSLKFVN